MKDIIKINNLNYQYNNQYILSDINFIIKEGQTNAIIGNNGSGKTTLLKALLGLIKYEGNIYIDDLLLNEENMLKIRSKIGVVFEDFNDSFILDTIEDDIAFPLENLGYDKEIIEHMITDISKSLDINHLLKRNSNTLCGIEKFLCALGISLVTKPKILIIDNSLDILDIITKNKILKIITKLQKEKKLTVIYLTHNILDFHNIDNIIILNKGKILINDSYNNVIKEDKIFNRIGIEIPFMIDLSLKLKLYGLVDNVIIDMDKMVDEIWK